MTMSFSSRRNAARTLIALLAIVVSAGGGALAVPAARAAGTPLSIKIVKNHFVDGAGHVVRLLGVNHTSAEYACVDGYGYDDGHFDAADAKAIASWHANAVRVPLNEDCWLGINGQPNSDQGADPALTQAGYQQEIVDYVADLNRHGIYAILDLHWTAPGVQVALEQQPMPDMDHSPAFWTSVANRFKNNHAVVFDLFNEPFDPTDPRSGDDPDQDDKVSWNCWYTGTHNGPAGGAPCYTAAYDENGSRNGHTYQIAGLQTLLNAVRTTGAKQPVLAGGLDYANDLGDNDNGGQWMNHAPDDPLNQEAASFHNYMGKACDHLSCWKNTLGTIAKHVPVVTGEFDEDDYLQKNCAQKTPSTFDERYMDWADSAGVSYLAWGWIVESPAEQDADGCSAYYLITNYSTYTPAKPNGTALHAHLAALAAPPPVRLTVFRYAVRTGGAKVGFALGSPSTDKGTVSGATVHAYVTTKGGKAHVVALGSVSFTLTAHKVKSVVLALTASAHKLLAAKRSLLVRFAITLTSAHHRRTVVHHTVTLRMPRYRTIE